MFAVFALMLGSLILTSCAQPRVRFFPPAYSLAGVVLLWLLAAIPTGFFLAISGNTPVSVGLALGLVGLFTMVSNAKRAMLGEALVFSDLALLRAVFRHPQFYFSALTKGQKAILVLACPAVPALLWGVFVADAHAHLAGAAVLVSVALILRMAIASRPWTELAQEPDAEADVLRHGLIPTIFMHWVRWRASLNPVAPKVLAGRMPERDELAIIIQCESFSDPVALFGDASLTLPGLEAARAKAWASGALQVSGFGAYTMRTEYGVLFGRSEQELGFRRFDPFLTAMQEIGFALPAKLQRAGWRSLFVHPHDMRFYNREAIMPAAGFAEIVGEDRFPPPPPAAGRYVTDAAIAAEILSLAQVAAMPTLIYGVTIENHGPWGAPSQVGGLRENYLRLLRNSDAMLATLHTALKELKRPATLVFFGDHCPSIPGVTTPHGMRDTPFVVLRFDRNGQEIQESGEAIKHTPAGLHHLVLQLLMK